MRAWACAGVSGGIAVVVLGLGGSATTALVDAATTEDLGPRRRVRRVRRDRGCGAGPKEG